MEADWEDLMEEVCTYLAIGFENGESELETITRLVWVERQKSVVLSEALDLIQREAAAACEHDHGVAGKISNVLAWKPVSRSATAVLDQRVTSIRPGAPAQVE